MDAPNRTALITITFPYTFSLTYRNQARREHGMDHREEEVPDQNAENGSGLKILIPENESQHPVRKKCPSEAQRQRNHNDPLQCR